MNKDDANGKGREGFVPAIPLATAPKAGDAEAITCGPPIMIKLTLEILKAGLPRRRHFHDSGNEDEVSTNGPDFNTLPPTCGRALGSAEELPNFWSALQNRNRAASAPTSPIPAS